MNRTDIINAIIKKLNFTSYLEIGTQWGANLNAVVCENKHGVDPDWQSAADFKMTSDEYFKLYPQKFDIVFIDGLHHADQFLRDFCNACNVLSPGGAIVCHDCNPTSEAMQRVPMIQDVWTGDVWRGWGAIVNWWKVCEVKEMPFVVDTDYGVGVIKVGEINSACGGRLPMLYPLDLPYQSLEKDRQKLLNLQSEKYFFSWLQSQK